MSFDEMHIRHCMLYEYQSHSNAKEAHMKISAIFPGALSLSKCEKWFQRFRTGDFDLHDHYKPGRPSNIDIDTLNSLIENDPKLSSRELARIINSSHTTTLRHLHEIGKISKCGIWVPHQLNANQLLQRTTVCTSLLARLSVDPFISRIVTGDEKWVLYNNVQRKRQWLSSGQQPIPTPKPGLHPKKVLLCVWWDIEGVIHHELLNIGQTITADIYCQQLDRLHDRLVKLRPSLVNRRGIVLQHDNAKPHTAKITREKLKKFGWDVLPHPSYSPDIAPSDYHLFQSLQHFMADKDYKDKDDVNTAISDFFASKPKSFYRDGIQALPQRWETVIENDGQYIID